LAPAIGVPKGVSNVISTSLEIGVAFNEGMVILNIKTRRRIILSLFFKRPLFFFLEIDVRFAGSIIFRVFFIFSINLYLEYFSLASFIFLIYSMKTRVR